MERYRHMVQLVALNLSFASSRYSIEVHEALSGQTLYVCVRDGAGNVSEPAAVTVKRSLPIFLPLIMR
jgi:hypothetical protein